MSEEMYVRERVEGTGENAPMSDWRERWFLKTGNRPCIENKSKFHVRRRKHQELTDEQRNKIRSQLNEIRPLSCSARRRKANGNRPYKPVTSPGEGFMRW